MNMLANNGSFSISCNTLWSMTSLSLLLLDLIADLRLRVAFLSVYEGFLLIYTVDLRLIWRLLVLFYFSV